MKHIKLYVKEVSEERRALTEAEKALVEIREQFKGNMTIQSIFDEYFDSQNVYYITPDHQCAATRTETTREATPEEEDAWWLLRRANGIEEAALTYAIDIKGCIALDAVTVKSAKQLLAGKEIYPEVVED